MRRHFEGRKLTTDVLRHGLVFAGKAVLIWSALLECNGENFSGVKRCEMVENFEVIDKIKSEPS
jgi:hypothetical protein